MKIYFKYKNTKIEGWGKTKIKNLKKHVILQFIMGVDIINLFQKEVCFCQGNIKKTI